MYMHTASGYYWTNILTSGKRNGQIRVYKLVYLYKLHIKSNVGHICLRSLFDN